ncbi:MULTISPECIES: VOC family protein [unclassified Mycobacterium]|uniref:VOC family protein n=1 Tax=unclassified Mycobacterium TaxID=2642494 RepID=UPI0029C7E3AA|nr:MULTISPECIES: VOC family protein [unclassified Mycobacterium]
MTDGQQRSVPGTDLDVRFSHVVIAVTDMDRSVAFYRDVLGMDVVFDKTLSGQPFDGRAVGGLLGGVSVELLRLASGRGDETSASVGTVGVQVISLSVPNVDAAYQAVSKAVEPATKPFDVDGVRMFFVSDPDGATVEFVEFPGAARTPAEMHRGLDGARP